MYFIVADYGPAIIGAAGAILSAVVVVMGSVVASAIKDSGKEMSAELKGVKDCMTKNTASIEENTKCQRELSSQIKLSDAERKGVGNDLVNRLEVICENVSDVQGMVRGLHPCPIDQTGRDTIIKAAQSTLAAGHRRTA